MQPGSDPEDIQTILSRFHTWAGKNPGTGNGKLGAPEAGSVREVSYEEAMRSYRQRHKAPARRAAAVPPEPSAPASAPEPPLCSPEQAQPLPPTLAPDLDVHFSAPPQPKAESTALARRPSPCAANAAIPAGKKVARRKAASSPKQAGAEPRPPAVVPTEPKPIYAHPQAPSKPKSRRSAPAQNNVALALQPPVAAPKKPAFKKVLAKSVRRVKAQAPAAPGKSAPPPDRDRRITTRFSVAEQRRLERAAAQSGLTLSAWLRQCALLAEAAYAPPSAPALPAKPSRRALPAPPAEPALFSTPAPSGLGNWLSLLRQRFLSSPARFSERA